MKFSEERSGVRRIGGGMRRMNLSTKLLIGSCVFASTIFVTGVAFAHQDPSEDSGIGREVAIPRHLKDVEEFTMPIRQLIAYGLELFNAKFTVQEGAGRPLTKGTV